MMRLVNYITLMIIFFDELTFLQQAHYHINELTPYYKSTLKRYYFNILIFLASTINHWISNIIIIILDLLILKKHIKRKIIPIKFTNRVKRTLISASIIYLILIIFVGYGYLIMINQLINLLIFIFINLIELIIQAYFIRRSKKKLTRINPTLIAVTGSAGKTSVKSILFEILKNKSAIQKTPKSYNTINGISKFINQDLKKYTKYLILEYGASYKKDIKKLCNYLTPDYSIITNIGFNHLKTFKSRENIIKEKMTLLESTKVLCVINNDDTTITDYINGKTFKPKIIKVGFKSDSDYLISDVNITKDGTSFKLNEKPIKTNLLSKHAVYNLSFAYAMFEQLNLRKSSENLAEDCFFKFSQTPNRLEVKKSLNKNIIIDDSYNSNYHGFSDALDILNLYDNKILITPGIVEAGSRVNQDICNKIIEVCDKVIIIKSNTGKVIYDKLIDLGYQNVEIASSIKEALSLVMGLENQTILIENDLPDLYLL